jgi:hypothetical protein
MANIANGVFKQLIYAKESALGVLSNVSGEGLTSPITNISLKAAISTVATTINETHIAVNGFLIVGQQLTIGNDTYTVATVGANLAGVSSTFTLAPVSVRTYAVSVPVKLIQSAEATNGGSLLTTAITPIAGQTFATPVTLTATDLNFTGAVGANTLTVAGTKQAVATVAIGQKMTFAGDTTVYTVTGSTGTLLGTSAITVTPYLQSPAKTSTTVATLLAGETAKYLRRVSSNLDLKKATFKSNEIRTDMQRAILSVGSNSVDGTISGELSNRTYSDFMASVVRREFAAPSAALTLVGVATPSGMTVGGTTLVLTAATSVSAASNASNLIKVGDVVSCPFAGSLAAYANYNFIVTGITSTVLTLELLVDTFASVVTTAEASGLVFTLRGKKTFVPKSGHLKTSFQIEHFFSDINQSELFTGCRATQLALKLSPSAMSTIDFTFMGQDMKTSPAIQLAATPQAAGNDAVVSANTGALYLKDTATGSLAKVGLVTAFDATVNGNGTVAQVVGSVITPDIFLGALDVTGNMSIYFTDTMYRDSFSKQSDVSIIAVFRSDASPSGNFISIVIPKARLTTATKDDGEKGLILTTPYSALVYDQSVGGTYFEETTIQIQDSAL